MKPESLQRCQVATPVEIIKFMWKIARSRRATIGKVVDLGAGDARFANHGSYKQYVGYEIDSGRVSRKRLSKSATVRNRDAFKDLHPEFDLCIGNPPYVKGSELDTKWRESICQKIEGRTRQPIARNANLFVYFIALGLLRTVKNGLVIQLVPFEWVTRPSAKALRDYIQANGWSVDVYRFREDVFDRVLTTASIVVIDKASNNGAWRYHEISGDFDVTPLRGPSGRTKHSLSYSNRSKEAHCLRGLSPGGQDIFVLTEHERVFYQLRLESDVYPAVTTLRHVPDSLESLDESSFQENFVDNGSRCWLIRSDVKKPSARVMDYLGAVKNRWKQYSTCTTRDPWWQFSNHAVASILLASGFRAKRPKVMGNKVGVVACGSVYAIFANRKKTVPILLSQLRNYDFSSRIVGHANGLLKLEVKQVNTVLQMLTASEVSGVRTTSRRIGTSKTVEEARAAR